MATKQHITRSFNLLLFVYLLMFGFARSLFEPINDNKTLFERLLNVSPLLASMIVIFALVIVVCIGGLINKELWNRLISDLFSLRKINYQEAASLSMVIIVYIIG